MLLYAGGSPQGRRSSPSPVCQQAKFLLSESGESDSPAGSVPPSWAMLRKWHTYSRFSSMQNAVNIRCPSLECPVVSRTMITVLFLFYFIFKSDLLGSPRGTQRSLTAHPLRRAGSDCDCCVWTDSRQAAAALATRPHLQGDEPPGGGAHELHPPGAGR